MPTLPDDYDSGFPMTTNPTVDVIDGEIVLIGLIGSGPVFDSATVRALGLALVAAADKLDAL